MRRALVWFFRRVTQLYFRRVEEAGNRPDPSTGGRIFVSNHVNGLVDPILVITNAPCRISPVGKSTLWKIPGLRWLLEAADAVPIERRRDNPDKSTEANEAVFDRIASWLAGGGNILIFPEGTSHNEPQLAAVKTGAARMLARAWQRGAPDVSFQSVALEFEARHLFRSRALILYGPVRFVRDFEEEGEALVRAMTESLRADLSELLVEGETWPDRVLIARVAEMLTHDEGDRSLERWNDIGRQVEAAHKALRGREDATVGPVRRAVDAYYALLEREGLADHMLAGSTDPSRVWGLGRTLAMIAVIPLAVVGAVLYWVPYQMPRLVARKTAEDPDEMSTYKLGTGLVVYPLWLAVVVTLSLVFLDPPASWWALAVVVTSPFAALAWLDATPSMLRHLRFRTHRARLDELRAARARALDAIRAVRDELGV